MRFAYIDSHGNEVPIPSVDALALRIELGAIGPDTELYDAQADRWGPAKTHEIFHTLSRDTEEEGFIAPPPPVAPAAAPPAAAAQPTPVPPKAQKPPRPAAPPPPEPAAPAALDLGLTLAEPPPGPPPKKEKPAAAAPRAGDSEAGASFDFGDLSAGLELEASPLDPPAGTGSGPAGLAPTAGGPLQPGGDDDLLLETPMSVFEPGAGSSWADPADDSGEALLDFSSPPPGAVAPEPEEKPVLAAPSIAPERTAPKARPAPPKPRRRRRSLTGPIVLVVLLGALGVGGYVSWPIVWPTISQALEARRAPERPPVVMPAIPAELLPRVRSLAEGAIADVVAEVDERTAGDLPVQPDRDWLAGVYLADASRFQGVEDFWRGMRGFLDGMRAAEWQLYHDRLVARVEREGTPAETAALIVERADSGFVAAAAARAETYGLLDALVTAALDLHEFLLLNEADIEYRPATTSTADPVLEAVPSSSAIGDRMWEMVDDITDALDALGTLDRVTRERLITAFGTRLQRVGIE